MFKKVISLLMAACLLCCLAACGENDSGKSRSKDNDSEEKPKYSTSVLRGANGLTKENADFLAEIDQEINITVCVDEDDYVNYVSYLAENNYGVYDELDTEYYEQTLKIIDNYGKCNKNFKIEFIDRMTSDFDKVTSKYPTEAEDLDYGDIIVSAGEGDYERHKVITYEDIYLLTEDTAYASYGYTYYTVTGNNIENALTGAINYVVNTEDKNILMLNGHSAVSCTTEYLDILSDSYYKVAAVTKTRVETIDNKYDAIVIACPTEDFTAEEIDVIDNFLDNNGNLGKGLIVFADASASYLPNLYGYLENWGIVIEDGIVYETHDSNHLDGDNTVFATISTGNSDITGSINGCITGSNVPMHSGKTIGKITATELLTLPYNTGVIAPKGTISDWLNADSDDGVAYASAILSTKTGYNSDDNLINSNVAVFSSIQFVSSVFSGYDIDNMALVEVVTEYVSGIVADVFSFPVKCIE